MARGRPGLCIDCDEITLNGTRCEDCTRLNEAERRIRKGNTSQRYGKEYQANRKIVIEHAKAEGMTCVLQIEGVCTTRVTSVDHIVPKARGGSDEVDNLQPVCSNCNSSKRDHIRNFF